MPNFPKNRGTTETAFQVGAATATPIDLVNNGGVAEARSALGALIPLRVATPVGDNDAVTKAYVKTLLDLEIVTAQISGAVALPANTGTEHFIVVTTNGVNGSIGQLYWDDGSGVGTVQAVTLQPGNLIIPTATFVGAITLTANTAYVWTGAAYSAIGGSSVAGPEQEIRVTTALATVSSVTSIPANSRINSVTFIPTTPYSGGATIQIGQTGTANLLMDTTDNNPQDATPDSWTIDDLDIPWGGATLPVLVTIGGAPAAGAGVVIVKYVQTPSN